MHAERSSLPVFVQLPGDMHKTLAGEFTWDAKTSTGGFAYARDYFSRGGYCLDPIVLKSRASGRETRNRGVFGVLRDAGPDAWGRDQIERRRGKLDELSLLQESLDDGAGNITFREGNALCAHTLKDVDDVSVHIGARGQARQEEGLVNAVFPTTSMGGAKPKVLVYDDGAFWIAKFPEKGDPEYINAANEHAMLVMAKRCGIEACDSRLHWLPDGRPVILVKRFDLSGTPDRFSRLGFASAHTVLRLGDPLNDSGLKSYPLFRHSARLWTMCDIGGELWRRLAFNVLVSNQDDHARNHALIYNGRWALSPAFDIVAFPVPNAPVRLCMSVCPGIGAVVDSPETLLLSADAMGVPREDAIEQLRGMSALVLEQWRELIGDGVSPSAIDRLGDAFRMAEKVTKFDFSQAPPPPPKTSRYLTPQKG